MPLIRQNSQFFGDLSLSFVCPRLFFAQRFLAFFGKLYLAAQGLHVLLLFFRKGDLFRFQPQIFYNGLFVGDLLFVLLELDYEGVEDPLDAGVNIIAEPPGKKLQKLSLLSGGEQALTAIAILFSILRLRPMPFCVLDEIEAALDEANVDRFARYLKKFSGETQFIVITHRKPTMELADALFGVTMQEKGVSKLVSVKLSDITDADIG